MCSVAEQCKPFERKFPDSSSLCKPLAPDTEVGALTHLEAAEGAASDAVDKICTRIFRLARALDHP